MPNDFIANVRPLLGQPCDFLLNFLEPDPNPITHQLLNRAKDAELHILKQGWKNSDLWSKQVLCIKDKQIFQREVLMYAQTYACWYARTIIPENCYQLESCFFDRLRKERLTPLVFNEPKVERKRCFYYPIDDQCMEFYWIRPLVKEKLLWLRLSQFEFHKQMYFYLMEIFLPDLMRFNT